jgi:endonuclease G
MVKVRFASRRSGSNGSDDVHRSWKGTRAFGIIVPNFAPVDMQAPWRNFRVTVDDVERLTGYDFFNKVDLKPRTFIERRRDTQ